jgi:MSHA pilin protein MshC
MRWSPHHHSGFTLIELVTTMVIAGIMTATMLPRFTGSHGFEERGFHDEALAALRYAQKTAISHRRLTCIAFTATTITVTIASANPAVACDTDLVGPNGKTPYKIEATGTAQFSAVPTGLTFSPLGQPSTATQVLAFTDLPLTVTVEAETGYVH